MSDLIMYSLNDEQFKLETVEDVMQELFDFGDLKAGTKYYSCMFKTINPAEFVSDGLLERIDEHMDEEFGDYYDFETSYINEDARKEFVEMLEGFLKKHTHIYKTNYYYPIGRSQAHEITQKEIDDSGLIVVASDI